MFQPPCLEVPPLNWVPIGPGPDPGVLMETSLNVNDVSFRLLAFRVPMPYSAGWSPNAYWEDDKELHTDGLLWDVAEYRDFVRRFDDASDAALAGGGGATIEGEVIAFDGHMGKLAATWKETVDHLGWSGQDWRPALINGCPYIVVGYAVGTATPDEPSVAVGLDQGRHWLGQPPHQHSFNLRIHGAPCGLAVAEVRAMGTVVRPLNPEADTWLADVRDFATRLAGAEGCDWPIDMGGRRGVGFIAPVDAPTWDFDVATFHASMSNGLPTGGMRWALEMPLTNLTPETTRLLEGLASATRRRKLVRRGSDIFFVSTIADAPSALGLPPDDTTGFRVGLYQRLSRVSLRALARSDNTELYLGRVVDRIYVFADTIYLGLAPAFVHLADMVRDGDMLRLGERTALETVRIAPPDAPPTWVSELPIIIDRPIQMALSEIERFRSEDDDD